MKKQYRKKAVFICILASILLCSCQSETKKKDSEESVPLVSNKIKSGEKGEDGFYQLDLQGLQNKIEQKESFVVMISQSTCSYCNTMKLMLYPYFDEYPDVPFFEVEVDMLSDKKSDVEANFTKLKEIIPEFDDGTPSFYSFKDGSLENQSSGAMKKQDWHEFLKEGGFVSGDIARTSIHVLAESDAIENETFTSIAKRLEASETFYLLCVEEDRYSYELSNKVAPVAEAQEKSVYVLNFSNPKKETDEAKMQKSYESVISNLQLSITPSIYKIENGKVSSFLIDNVTQEEIVNLFK